MATFILTLNWTEQGIRAVKEAPRRATFARDLGKRLNVEVKQVFLTSGDSDLLVIVEAPDGDDVAKFCMVLGSHGNVRTRTVRAWPETEFMRLVSELP